jgi:hypothetical protein
MPHRQFRPNDGAEADVAGRPVEPGSPVDPVAIELSERRIPEHGGTFRQRLGKGRSLQKTECRGSVELDVAAG